MCRKKMCCFHGDKLQFFGQFPTDICIFVSKYDSLFRGLSHTNVTVRCFRQKQNNPFATIFLFPNIRENRVVMMLRQHSVMGTFSSQPLRALLQAKGARVQEYALNAARMTTIVSEKGIRFTFPPFCLAHSDGSLVEGEVTLLLQEIFTKADMLLAGLTSTSEDRLMESAGQFYLSAFQHDQPLQLLTPIKAEVPVSDGFSNPLSVNLFNGSMRSTLAFSDEALFDWQMIQPKSLKIKKLSGKKYFQVNIPALNWMGCYHFYNKKSPRIMVSARCIATVDTFDEQMVFLVFRDLNAIARMYRSSHHFSSFNIPANLAATVIAIASAQGNFFFGKHPLERTSSQMIQVHLEAIGEKELLAQLQQL